MPQMQTQPSSTQKAGSRAGKTRRNISSRGSPPGTPWGLLGSSPTWTCTERPQGRPSRLLPSPPPPPCTECLLWVRFCTRFGMGREEGGGREGCPQPFPWLLCVWVIIIFVTIPNQIRLQAGGAGGPGMRKANNNKKNKNKIKKNPEC